MSEYRSKHDTFFRAIMGNQQIALDYFRSCLPAPIFEKLNLSTLRQLPDTYVSKELQTSISDIVYACQRADGVGEVKISLLIEHKSYVDKYTPIQIGSYIFSGLLKQISDGENPSLIIPILLYHGKNRWEYKTLSSLFNGLEPELLEFIPDYQYVFHNLGEIPDGGLLAMRPIIVTNVRVDLPDMLLPFAAQLCLVHLIKKRMSFVFYFWANNPTLPKSE